MIKKCSNCEHYGKIVDKKGRCRHCSVCWPKEL